MIIIIYKKEKTININIYGKYRTLERPVEKPHN